MSIVFGSLEIEIPSPDPNLVFFWWYPSFIFNDCYTDPNYTSRRQPSIPYITGTGIETMFLKEQESGSKLYLPAPTDKVALDLTPGTFSVLPPHDGSSLTEHPFFYMDDTRTFFVVPRQMEVQPSGTGEIQVSIEEPFTEVEPLPQQYRDPRVKYESTSRKLYTRRLRNVAVEAGGGRYIRAMGKIVGSDRAAYQGAGTTALARIDVPRTVTQPVGQIARWRDTWVQRMLQDESGGLLETPATEEDPRYQFQLFYHPYVSAFVSEFNRDGLDGLLVTDERYLPFEGAGVISEWYIEPPNDFRQFDYDTISDIVLHLHYTAREGDGSLKK